MNIENYEPNQEEINKITELYNNNKKVRCKINLLIIIYSLTIIPEIFIYIIKTLFKNDN